MRSTAGIDGAHVTAVLARALRVRGVDVPIGCELACTEALALVGLSDERRLVAAARQALIRRPADFDAFDDAVEAVLVGRRGAVLAVPEPPVLRIALRHDADDGDADRDASAARDDPPSPEDLTLRWSAVEVLRHADLAHLSAEERTEAHALISQLRTTGPWRTSRRLRPDRSARRGRLDVRRPIAGALRTGGEVPRPVRRTPRLTPRRVVVLVDVSGAMEPYARALLRFAHALTSARRRVEVFAVGTRLTRLTRALSTHDPDVALDGATAAIADWSGGTRLGDALATFNARWGVRGMARGAVVVILSDGWDRGDPADIAEQMARLHRVTHRLIWVNPLAAAAGFAPRAAGMAAALPHLDDLREGHSVASLEALAALLADL